ncbi:MAG: hypothetical protein O7C62_08820, partial [Rickettsia endosymbiont of Ixodes persulcatus]|nr:hypothetical protein [Rickettsia endosymbiont of Ixodes persulcatus]
GGQNLTSATTLGEDVGCKEITELTLFVALLVLDSTSPSVVADVRFCPPEIANIDADLQGTLRGIVARDVYAEANNIVMIPKGSRLIGDYSFNASPGKTRVQISWNRVILPNGIDINIDSNGTDELGRQGASGVVDTKIASILTSTILLAGVSVATYYATSKIPEINNNPIVESDDKDKKDKQDNDSNDQSKSKSTKTTLPVKILSQAVDDFSNSIKDIIKKYSNNNPTIYVDQGTLLKVFVNKDIIFPRSAVHGIDIVN